MRSNCGADYVASVRQNLCVKSIARVVQKLHRNGRRLPARRKDHVLQGALRHVVDRACGVNFAAVAPTEKSVTHSQRRGRESYVPVLGKIHRRGILTVGIIEVVARFENRACKLCPQRHVLRDFLVEIEFFARSLLVVVPAFDINAVGALDGGRYRLAPLFHRHDITVAFACVEGDAVRFAARGKASQNQRDAKRTKQQLKKLFHILSSDKNIFCKQLDFSANTIGRNYICNLKLSYGQIFVKRFYAVLS